VYSHCDLLYWPWAVLCDLRSDYWYCYWYCASSWYLDIATLWNDLWYCGEGGIVVVLIVMWWEYDILIIVIDWQGKSWLMSLPGRQWGLFWNDDLFRRWYVAEEENSDMKCEWYQCAWPTAWRKPEEERWPKTSMTENEYIINVKRISMTLTISWRIGDVACDAWRQAVAGANVTRGMWQANSGMVWTTWWLTAIT